MSTAENILHILRPNSKFTALEAKLLDLCLVLHAERGGGNNFYLYRPCAKQLGYRHLFDDSRGLRIPKGPATAAQM